MQAILNQLGDLLLGSVPTMVCFIVLLSAYAVLVRRPLQKVLADRHSRTGGAMDEARAAIAAAEAKTTEYEDRLRKARGEIFEARQARTKASNDAREKALAAAREQAQGRIAEARAAVERSADQSRAQLEASIEVLATQIRAAILPGRPVAEVSTAGAAQ